VADDTEHQRQEDVPRQCTVMAERDLTGFGPGQPGLVGIRDIKGDLCSGVPHPDHEHATFP
jgi:hypothetical protein